MTKTHKYICSALAIALVPGGVAIGIGYGAYWLYTLLMRRREGNRVVVERPKLRIVK